MQITCTCTSTRMHTHTHIQSDTHKTCSQRKNKQLTYTSHTEKNTSVHDFPDFQIFPMDYLIWLFRQFFPLFLFFSQPMSQQQCDDITGITTVLPSGKLNYEFYQYNMSIRKWCCSRETSSSNKLWALMARMILHNQLIPRQMFCTKLCLGPKINWMSGSNWLNCVFIKSRVCCMSDKQL